MGVMRAMGAAAVAAGLLLAGCGGGAPATRGAGSAAAGSPPATATASGHFGRRPTGSATAGGFRGGGFFNISAAASYLGVSSSQLQTDLRSGKTLADVARAQGKSVQGLEQAMVAAVRSQLDQAVRAGRMTAAQEQQRLASVQGRIGQFVNHTRPATASATGSGG